jgi:prepilin-type N-terminal cleavage/methylation domain-containing protein
MDGTRIGRRRRLGGSRPWHESAPRRAPGFTLVEILVVLAILSVLAGLVTVSVQRARKFADVKKVRFEIQQLEAAALAYKNGFGDYPPTTLAHTLAGFRPNGANDGNESLVVHVGAGKHGGPFFPDFEEARLVNADGDRLDPKYQGLLKKELESAWNTPELLEFTDLWGNPYVYIHHRDYAASAPHGYQGPKGRVQVKAAKSATTGTFQKATSFQIWSFGPNGQNDGGEGDDITSWTQ